MKLIECSKWEYLDMGIYVFEKLQERDTKGMVWMKNKSSWSSSPQILYL